MKKEWSTVMDQKRGEKSFLSAVKHFGLYIYCCTSPKLINILSNCHIFEKTSWLSVCFLATETFMRGLFISYVLEWLSWMYSHISSTQWGNSLTSILLFLRNDGMTVGQNIRKKKKHFYLWILLNKSLLS